jgi:hypothetical protein
VERPLVRIKFSITKKPRARNGKRRFYRVKARKDGDGGKGAVERGGS